MITSAVFGTLADGRSVDQYTLTNRHGLQARILTYGGILHTLHAPDREGRWADVLMGFDHLAHYEANTPYFGAVIGRCANRIASGRFKIDGCPCQLTRNFNQVHHLHGGRRGFDQKVWRADTGESKGVPYLRLTCHSRDGEEGYPGNLSARVEYRLGDDNGLHIGFQATTDRATIVNLAHHAYFNLTGSCENDIRDHVMQIDADGYTEVDAAVIPTGRVLPVQGTPFDFRQPTPVGSRLDSDHPQLARGGGYDHNWVLNTRGTMSRPSVRVSEPSSGRVLEVYTTQPGVQFYSGNNLDGRRKGKDGVLNRRRHAFCLETQHFPDAPNHANFPSILLRPGEIYRQTTIYRFMTE